MISGVKKYNNFRYSSIEWLLTALVIDNEEAFSQKKNFPWYDSIIWQVSNTWWTCWNET